MPSNRLAMDNFKSWTMQKLIKELSKLSIRVPANIRKAVMKKLYFENRTSPSPNTDIRMNSNGLNDNTTTADIVPLNADSIEENNTPLNDDSERQVSTRPPVITSGSKSSSSSNMAAANNGMMCSMLNTIQSMQQTVLGLQNTVLHLVAEKKNKTEDNSLGTAMAAIRQQVAEQHSSGQGPTPRSSGHNPSMASHQIESPI